MLRLKVFNIQARLLANSRPVLVRNPKFKGKFFKVWWVFHNFCYKNQKNFIKASYQWTAKRREKVVETTKWKSGPAFISSSIPKTSVPVLYNGGKCKYIFIYLGTSWSYRGKFITSFSHRHCEQSGTSFEGSASMECQAFRLDTISDHNNFNYGRRSIRSLCAGHYAYCNFLRLEWYDMASLYRHSGHFLKVVMFFL